MTFVLDASLTLAWCFHDELSEPVARVRDQLESEEAVAPRVHWDLEIWNGLLMAFRRGRIRSVEENARLIAELPVERLDAPLEQALILAARHQLSSYDALYLGLSLREAVPLATLDVRLATAARREGLDVLGATSPRR